MRVRRLIATALAAPLLLGSATAATTNHITVVGAGLSLSSHSEIHEPDKFFALTLAAPNTTPFSQSAIKKNIATAKLGPPERVPHFIVRLALPMPPDNATNVPGIWTGLDDNVWAHNHSPGLEVLPNGDVLAIYFSATNSSGAAECAPDTRFVQARLRHGAEIWDPPELFLDFQTINDQSALLWTEGNTIRFFGGGRDASDLMPFKMATSTNNGATWTVSLPQLEQPATDYTAQPINNAFRGGDGAIYFAMDAEKDQSFLWRSTDGIHWHDMGGRTGARHSTIIPLDDRGGLLSLGGKNGGINAWTPINTSSDWGKTWSESKASPFPALGGNQRPSLIRLANGHLLFVTDTYHRNTKKSPEGWPHGEGCVVAVSKDNGATWHFKRLPVTLVHEKDNALGTLGYATARQAPNGLIHVLTTMTHPCLHYEFNEAWVFSDAGDLTPEQARGAKHNYQENYPDGRLRARWSASVGTNGRYLLTGKETTFYENGRKEYEATYVNGRKTGTETFWSPEGVKLWSWRHDRTKSVSTWTHYWPNGQKQVESRWNTRPTACTEGRKFTGLVADGISKQWDARGRLIRTSRFENGRLLEAAKKGATRASD